MLTDAQRRHLIRQTERRMQEVAKLLRRMHEVRWQKHCPVYRAADTAYRALRRLGTELELAGKPPDNGFPRSWRPR